MRSPILSEWGLYRKTSQRKKPIKSYVVEESDEEEGLDTDMARIRVKPTKAMDLDDAVVEDTPPSKIKGMRAQENHDMEGSSKVRTRFGAVARGIKAKHPRLHVEESAPRRTRSGSVARGIKAKHPCSRKHQDVNVGEIRETAYRASLNGIKTLIEEVNLTDAHKKIMKKTPFWKIFQSIIENKLTSAHCRKSDKMIIKIINAYDSDTGGFKLGGKTIRITRDDIFNIFGISGGSEKFSFKYGSRDGIEMARRGSIEAERLSSSSLKELVKKYAVRNNKAGRQDFVRLLCAYLLHSLFFPAGTTVKWLCEHTNLVKPLHPEESLGIIKWRTMDLVKAFREIALDELEFDQVVSRQPNVHDTNMESGNIDNGDARMSREKTGSEGGNDSAEYGDGTECSKRKYSLVTGKKGIQQG
ncbi:hypothetical protein RHMOL_Rhmol04G0238000 [Rhododendron molle]|uniref:Uncharacterized protein n=1 Tax=Rhododendron molle TaxID=49168 RepID=A0ACC0P4Y9_RHOML|nr:hypothetical protein RHMOL_Rhmol04G0238000 [Rhododendron molle]